MNRRFRSLGTLLIILASMLSSAIGATEEVASLWLMVAQAPIIAKGTLRVPVRAIEDLRANGRNDYVNLEIENAEFLKGSATPTFFIRWFSGGRDDAPDLPLLKHLNGREVTVFTLRSGPAEKRAIYFAGYTPEALSPSSDILLRNVRTEIERQKQLLAQFPNGIGEVPKARFEIVRRLIENMTIEGKAETAFKELLQLGPEGVMATIILMDDRRPVAAEWLQLANPPGHWEAHASYKPEKVVDALD